NDREGEGTPQPGPQDPRRGHHDARQADGAGARYPDADTEGVRREGVQDGDHQERAARGEPGLQGIDLHIRPRIHRGDRVLQPVRGGHRPCLDEDYPRPWPCGTMSTTSTRWRRPRVRRSDAWWQLT